MKSTQFLIATLLSLLFVACQGPEQGHEDTLFRPVPASRSNIAFANRLEETPEWNIIEYLYFYNGGGVAVGDVNNDGLPDIYFTANTAPNRLYLNKGNLEFEDVTEAAGVAGQGNWKTGVAMADVNGDGWLDIYVCQVGRYKSRRGRNQLFINRQDGTFAEQAEAYGLDFQGFSTQAAFFDYDRDGDLDCYLLNHSIHSAENYVEAAIRRQPDSLAGDRLYRNEGGRFADVTRQAGLYSSRVGYGLGVAVSDLDDDGWPDLYVSNDFHENDYLYFNNGDGTFRDGTTGALGHTSTFSMGSDIADFNNDGRADILSLDMKPEEETILKSSVGSDPFNIYQFKLQFGYHYQFPRNMLQLNQGQLDGQTRFSEIGQLAGIAATDWSWSPLITDLDLDGRKDIFITNGIWRRPNDLDYLKFTSNQQVQQNAGNLEMAAHMPEGLAANYAYRNQGGLAFEDVSRQWGLDYRGCSNAAAYADLDNDGDLDLVVNNLNANALVFENQVRRQQAPNFIRLRLKARGSNTFGIGSRATLFVGGRRQTLELFTTRGFQAGVEPVLSFGLGETETIDSLVIRWPDGTCQLIPAPAANQLLAVEQGKTAEGRGPSAAAQPLFEKVPASISGLGFRHRENPFNDFDREKLIPHQLSAQGPCLAVADVNGDGREDLYLGGGRGQAGAVYLQSSSGGFQPADLTAFIMDFPYEDTGAAFFDADGDGRPDLYVVSGGGEAEPAFALQDRLYMNRGKGRFERKFDALPPLEANGSCVTPLDFDQDGAMDLFVGVRSVPGSYGLPPRSYLLRNDGRGNFTDVTGQVAPQLASLGMVTGAALLAREGERLLAVAGEWMPVTFFDVNQPVWAQRTVPGSNGWWNTLSVADLDGDGDDDLLLGNNGLNSSLRASRQEPLELYVKDFDQNGSTDPLLTYYRQGRRYTYFSKDELAEQLVQVKKRYLDYRPFAESTFEEAFPPEMLEGAVHLQAFTLASCWAENQGAGSFELHELPVQAQFAPLFGLTAGDFNSDGRQDILGVGNWYGVRPSLGRYDASYGLCLGGGEGGAFMAVEPAESGFAVFGEGRAIAPVRRADGSLLLVVGRNDDVPVVFRALEVPGEDGPFQ